MEKFVTELQKFTGKKSRVWMLGHHGGIQPHDPNSMVRSQLGPDRHW
jgi:hypothetical protein